MRKLLYSILLVFVSFSVLAQMEVVEGSFKEVPGFVILDHDKTDDNDVPIAVIKVKTQNINDAQRHKLLFQGNMSVYLDWEFKVGEVWLYLTYHADYIKISHPDFSTTEYVFPFDMKPLGAYELILT